MSLLSDEIEADLYNDEILDDLFEEIDWNGHLVKAGVDVTPVNEEFDELGGSRLGDVLEVTFRRKELAAKQADLTMFNTTLTYNSRKYDITQVFERPNHPKITVMAVLRDHS